MQLMNQGSLVLDLSTKGTVVWRSVAQARVSFEIDEKKREACFARACGISSSPIHRNDSSVMFVHRRLAE